MQAEYAALLAKKKRHTDYRKALDDMKELLTIKANVDRLMVYDEQEKPKETARQEKSR